MNDGAIEEAVIAFIARQTSARIQKLTLQTRLAEDLGVAGDDAIELFEGFSEEFQVDLSDFQYDRHFGPEGSDLIGWLLSILSKEHRKELKPVMIQDLVAAAKAKRWVMDYSENPDS